MSSPHPSSDDLRSLRRTLRLTLRITPRGQELVSVESLDMICPPAPGGQPELGVHSGHWVTLDAADGSTLFARPVDSRAFGAAEIHAPDGTIRHVVGRIDDAIVEVLLPDLPDGVTATLVGQPMDVEGRGEREPRHSERLATFDLRGGQGAGGGGQGGGTR